MTMSTNNAVSPLKVAAVVSFYMSAALVMVFTNKFVLTNFSDLPLLFLLNQLVIAVVLLHIAALLSSKIEIPKLDLGTSRKLFPVVFVNVVGLVFNTLCLRGVEASFFQIARGLVLPLTIAVAALHTHARPSKKVLAAAVVVTLGFFLGVNPSGIPAASVPSFMSLVYGVLSSLFIALHAVLIKTSLPHCHNSSIQLAYWTNAGSAALLLPFILLNGEHAKFHELVTSSDIRIFVWGSAVTGFFGFLLCVSAVISIKVTSPITHMFSSAVRSVFQTLLGVWLFGDILTASRAVSIGVILGGTMYYTWVRALESASPPKPIDIESLKSTHEHAEPSEKSEKC
jgi:GDP-fucose transporter C1